MIVLIPFARTGRDEAGRAGAERAILGIAVSVWSLQLACSHCSPGVKAADPNHPKQLGKRGLAARGTRAEAPPAWERLGPPAWGAIRGGGVLFFGPKMGKNAIIHPVQGA